MEPLLYIAMAHSLFISFFFISKFPNRLSDKIISFFMLSLAIPLISQIIVSNIQLNNIILATLLRIDMYPLTYGPFLYIYAQSMTGKKISLEVQDLLHFLPFIAFTLLAFILYHGHLVPDFNTQRPFNRIPDNSSTSLFLIQGIADIISFTIYTTLILFQLKRHDKNVSDHFSFKSSRINLLWLEWITISFILAYTIVLLLSIEGLFQIDTIHGPPHLIAKTIGLTFLIFTISFFCLNQKIIFNDEEPVESTQKSEENKKDKKYEKSGLKDEDASLYLNKLEDYMERKKPYKNGDLTIMEISNRLSIPKHYLTQVINELAGKNFYTYINQYRIDEVKSMMKNPKFEDYTILALAYESGFNSKSAFNTIFKKTTGLSPSDYRNNIKNQNTAIS